MAIYHLSVKNGAPATASGHAAYILREGKYAADNEDLQATESGNMPAWAASDPMIFWTAADLHERVNGRPYRELEVALPRELSDAQRVDLAREFVSNLLGDRHAYTWSIHSPDASDKGEQPHFHLMFTERANDGNTRDPRQFFRRWNAENPESGGAGKDRYFNSQRFVWDVRNEWAELANEHLARAGIEARIDARSYRDQGLNLEPQAKRGPEFHGQERGVLAAITAENRERMRVNGERIAESPSLALDALTAHQSTFTKRDLQRFLLRNSDSPEQFEAVSLKVLHSPELVPLRGADGSERFTSKSIFEAETRLVKQSAELARRKGQGVSESIREAVAADRNFNAGQHAAFEILTGERALTAVNGAAGTGKSYVLTSVREAYEQAGFKVLGAALQGRTADDLETETGIKSGTIHRLLWQLERGEVRFDAKTVLVIDETGLVGSKQLSQVVDHAASSGAVLRLVGDQYQLHAVAAGDAFAAVSKELTDAGASAALTEIQRQRADWQRAASQALAEHRIADGIEAYRSRGFVTEHATQAEARTALLHHWWNDRQSDPSGTQLLVTYSNQDRQELNREARAMRRNAGELGPDVRVESVAGRLDLAAGDRLAFTRNDTDIGVKNGTLGTITAVSKRRISVRLDAGRTVEIDPRQYQHFDLGYSLTSHKSQGATVDRSYLLATSSMTARPSYVSMTRHRTELRVAYSREHFSGARDFDWKLSRVERKDFSADLLRRSFAPAPADAIRESLADRRGIGAATPVVPPAPKPVGNDLTAEQIERMTSAQLTAAIERLRPPEWEGYRDRDETLQIVVAAARGIQAKVQTAENARRDAEFQVKAWRDENAVKTGMHDQGLWRSSYLREREAVIAESGKTAAELAEPLKNALEQLKARIDLLARQYRDEHGPAARRVAQLEKVAAAKQESETLLRKIGDIARDRVKGAPGYRDGDERWQSLPPGVRALVTQYQNSAPEQVADLVKDERMKEVARWIQGQARSYGMGD